MTIMTVLIILLFKISQLLSSYPNPISEWILIDDEIAELERFG